MNHIKYKFATLACIGTGCATITVVTDFPNVLKKILQPQEPIVSTTDTIPNIHEVKKQIEEYAANIKAQQKTIDNLFDTKEKTATQIMDYEHNMQAQTKQSIKLKEHLHTTEVNLKNSKTQLTQAQEQKLKNIETIKEITNQLESNKQFSSSLNVEIKNLAKEKELLKNFINVEATTTKTIQDKYQFEINMAKIHEMIKEINDINRAVLTPIHTELALSLQQNSINQHDYEERLSEYTEKIISYNAKNMAFRAIYDAFMNNKTPSLESQATILKELTNIKNQLLELQAKIKEKTKALHEAQHQKTIIVETIKDSKKKLADAFNTEHSARHNIKEQEKDKQKTNKDLKTNQIQLIENNKKFWQTKSHNADARKKLIKEIFQKTQKVQKISNIQNQLD